MISRDDCSSVAYTLPLCLGMNAYTMLFVCGVLAVPLAPATLQEMSGCKYQFLVKQQSTGNQSTDL